ncbi:hypothetical protein ATJ88_2183 [Isoptericola jiangsuensis]|uniref:DUF308 domain-containing protein n=1 Tax=Isoptericola jiangsuensis TaxID=548579 RepID=A0A2A9EY57_9MICO|nr:hypothetical protein [Isoptericola jiangsuensis]PFG43486.1 hypothetical protein ATJ88_2183 [Isoptericola jiangsuensis]
MAPIDRGADPDDLPDADVDARWSDIVARLGDLQEPEGDLPRVPDPVDGGSPTAQDAPGTAPASGPRDWPTTPEDAALEEHATHFVPPDPGPITDREPLTSLAWTVVVAVPLLLVLRVVVGAFVPTFTVPGWLTPTLGALFLAGVGVLVWRMPHRRDPDDTDPGAVV